MKYTAPLAAVMALSFWPLVGSIAEPESPALLLSQLGLLVGGTYGALVVATVLTKQYTGFIVANPYLWALRRYPVWLLTWLLVILGSMVGYLLLIIPGVIFVLRSFWADEFALAHECSATEAIKRSLALTKGSVGAIFVFQFLVGLACTPLALVGYVAMFLSILMMPAGGAVMLALGLFVGAWIFWLGYGAMHAIELAKFYGMRASRMHSALPSPGDNPS